MQTYGTALSHFEPLWSTLEQYLDFHHGGVGSTILTLTLTLILVYWWWVRQPLRHLGCSRLGRRRVTEIDIH